MIQLGSKQPTGQFPPIPTILGNFSSIFNYKVLRFCKGRNEYSTIKGVEDKIKKNLSLFTIVRDPIDRFISGFTDKCIMEATQRKRPCYGCGGNFSCFVEKQYQRQMNYVTGKNRFIGYEDIHFSPQTW